MSVRLLLALGFGATACATVAASQTAASRVAIPLCAGLTIVTAIDDPRGDYESVKRITKVTAEAVELTVNGDRPLPTGVRKIRVARTVRRTDLADATFYLHYFDPRAPSEVPGSTALGTSSAVLSKLRATGAAELAVVDPGFAAAPAAEMMNHLFRYRLTRLNVGVVPVTVNGAKVDLPAIVADARTLGDRAQFAFLDDDRHPITLRYAFNNGAPGDETGRLQVVRISYDCSETPSATPSAPAPIGRLESALRDLGRADVYEIYFEFNSDRIREESEPTLREIAEVMRRHADWAIGIEGHTDSIAGDAYNLDLSTRRAAAVREALAARHGVAASRLTTAGFGESRPRDRNDTLEGRARNRRVELVRRP